MRLVDLVSARRSGGAPLFAAHIDEQTIQDFKKVRAATGVIHIQLFREAIDLLLLLLLLLLECGSLSGRKRKTSYNAERGSLILTSSEEWG
jgi:hypothetical protein